MRLKISSNQKKFIVLISIKNSINNINTISYLITSVEKIFIDNDKLTNYISTSTSSIYIKPVFEKMILSEKNLNINFKWSSKFSGFNYKNKKSVKLQLDQKKMINFMKETEFI